MAGLRVEGRAAWQQALVDLLAQPGAGFALYSPDYADWPLNRAELIDALELWARGRRQPCVRLLAERFDTIERLHPRFVAWCQRCTHLVQCRIVDEGSQPPAEGLLLPDRGLLALPADHGRVALHCDGGRWRDALETFDAAWERSTPGQLGAGLGL